MYTVAPFVVACSWRLYHFVTENINSRKPNGATPRPVPIGRGAFSAESRLLMCFFFALPLSAQRFPGARSSHRGGVADSMGSRPDDNVALRCIHNT